MEEEGRGEEEVGRRRIGGRSGGGDLYLKGRHVVRKIVLRISMWKGGGRLEEREGGWRRGREVGGVEGCRKGIWGRRAG